MTRRTGLTRTAIVAAAVMAAMQTWAEQAPPPFGGGAGATSDFTPVGEDDTPASAQAAFGNGMFWGNPIVPAPPAAMTAYASAGAAGPGQPWATAAYGATGPAGPLDNGSPFTWTFGGVDLGQGLTRGYSRSAVALFNGPGTISSRGSVNVGDGLDVHGGSLGLSLSINSSWLTQVTVSQAQQALGSGSADLLVGMSLMSTFDCPIGSAGLPECKTWSMQLRADSTFAPDLDGTLSGSSRYQWETQLAQSQMVVDTHLGSSVDETRSLTIANIDPGRYVLRYWMQIATDCQGGCDALVDFGHTGYTGVVGDFTSENGYGYARAASVPEPASSVLLGCGLAALLLARRRRRARAQQPITRVPVPWRCSVSTGRPAPLVGRSSMLSLPLKLPL